MALAIPLWAVIVIPTAGGLVLLVFFTALWLRRRRNRLSQHDHALDEEPQTMARYKVRRGRMVPASWNVSLTGSMFGMHQFQSLEEDNLTGGRRITRSRSPFSFFSDKSKKNRSMLSFTPSEKSRNLDDIGRTTPTRENNREFLNNVDQAFLSKVPAAKVTPISRSRTGATGQIGGKRKVRPGAVPKRTSSYRERTFQSQRHPHDTTLRVLSPIQASPCDSLHTLPRSPLSGSTTLAGHASPGTAVSSSSAEKESRSKAVGTPSPLNPRSAWLQPPNEPPGSHLSLKEASRPPRPSEAREIDRNVSSQSLKDGKTSSTSLEKPKASRSEATLPPSTSTSFSSSNKPRSKSMAISGPRPSQAGSAMTTTTDRARSRTITRPKSSFDSTGLPRTPSSAENPTSNYSDAERPKTSYFPRQKGSSDIRPESVAPPAPPPKLTSSSKSRPTSALAAKSLPLRTSTSLTSLISDHANASPQPTSVVRVQLPTKHASSMPSLQTEPIPTRQPPSLPSLPKPIPTTTPPAEDATPLAGGESHWRPPSAWANSKAGKETDRTAVRKSSIGLGLGAGVEVGVSKKGSVLRKKSMKGAPLKS